MKRQCPKCGKASTKTQPFIDGFCTTCFFEQHPLITLRRSPEAKICSRCQAYYVSGQWVHQANHTVDAHLLDCACALLEPFFDPSQPTSFEIHLHDPPEEPLSKAKQFQVKVIAHADERDYTEQKIITIPLEATVCSQCRKAAGGYFEAVIQIRSSAGKITLARIDQIVEFIRNRLLDQELPPSSLKLSEKRGGFDIKCISSRFCRILAKKLSEQFGLIQKVSSKVVGRTREGKNLRRDTYSLRFPLYQVGDVISYKEEPYKITGLRSGQYILTSLLSDHRETVSPKDLNEIDAEFLNNEVHTFQVISIEEELIQLMRQEDYTIYDLPRPERELPVGSMVSAIEWKKRLVLLPKDDSSVKEGDDE